MKIKNTEIKGELKIKKLGIEKNLNLVRLVSLTVLTLFICVIHNYSYPYLILTIVAAAYSLLILKYQKVYIEIDIKDYLIFFADMSFVVLSLMLTGFWYSVLDIIFIVPLTMYVLQYGRIPGYAISFTALLTFLLLLIMHPSDYLAIPRILHSLFIIIVMLFLTYFIGSIRNNLFKSLNIDHLTKTCNREYLLTNLYSAHEKFKTCSIDYGIIVFDIDNFKTVNDEKGHTSGDNLLREFAGIIKQKIRSEDIVGRLGGDEFLAIINNVSYEQFAVVKERIYNNLTLYFDQKKRFGI